MRLYSGPMSMFGAKVEIAIKEKRLDCEVVMVPFGLAERYEPKNPDVLRINPKGQVPVLIDGGHELYDSTQIFEYLEDAYPEPPLWPRSCGERLAARQLEHGSDEVFFPYVVRLMRRGGEGRDEAVSAAQTYHAAMNSGLAREGGIAGAFGFADIAFFMATLFGDVVGAPIPRQCEKLIAWRDRMTARAAVRDVAEPMLDYMIRNGVTNELTRASILD